MGTVEPGGEFTASRATPSAGAAGAVGTCTTDELEGTVHAARGMERHVLGKSRASSTRTRGSASRSATTRSRPTHEPRSYDMRLTDTKNASRTVDVAPARRASGLYEGASTPLDVTSGKLLYRSVIEFYDQKKHDFKEELHTALCAEKTPPSSPCASQNIEMSSGDLQVEILREEPLIAYLPNWTKPGDCADMEGRALRRGLTDASVFGERTLLPIDAHLRKSRMVSE